MNKKIWLLISIVLLALALIWFFLDNSQKITMQQSNQGQTKETLKVEVTRTCGEAERQIKKFQTKYPGQEQQHSEEALKSEEWREYMSWLQACDTAKNDLINSK